MKRLQESGSSQQKRQKLSALPTEERILYDLILSKENSGISKTDMRRETNLPIAALNKHMKALMNKSMVKELPSIKNKGIKIYMGTEFEPSKDITGGHFYSEGSLDTVFIDALKQTCLQCISLERVSTCDGCLEWVKKSGVFTTQVTGEQIEEILQTLVLDDEIMQMTSTGYGDFASIPVGKTCYICKSKGEKKSADSTPFPCFSCQRMSFCSSDGVVSPTTCVYFQKWLDFF